MAVAGFTITIKYMLINEQQIKKVAYLLMITEDSKFKMYF